MSQPQALHVPACSRWFHPTGEFHGRHVKLEAENRHQRDGFRDLEASDDPRWSCMLRLAVSGVVIVMWVWQIKVLAVNGAVSALNNQSEFHHISNLTAIE